MFDKKATDVLVLHVAPLTSVADYLVIGSADSDRQASAIADHIEGPSLVPLQTAEYRRHAVFTVGFDGLRRCDRPYFQGGYPEHYALERLWADAKRVTIPDKPTVAQPTVAPRPVKRKKVPAKTKA